MFGRLLVAAHHDHRDLGGEWVAAQRAQGGEAVHAGQHDVEKDQARQVLAGHLDATFGVEGLKRLVAALLEHASQQSDHRGRVVDDQDLRAALDAGACLHTSVVRVASSKDAAYEVEQAHDFPFGFPIERLPTMPEDARLSQRRSASLPHRPPACGASAKARPLRQPCGGHFLVGRPCSLLCSSQIGWKFV